MQGTGQIITLADGRTAKVEGYFRSTHALVVLADGSRGCVPISR